MASVEPKRSRYATRLADGTYEYGFKVWDMTKRRKQDRLVVIKKGIAKDADEAQVELSKYPL